MASGGAIGGGWDAVLAPGRDDGRLVAESSEPATMAKLTDLPAELHPDLAEALAADGIESLSSHQAEASGPVMRGDVVGQPLGDGAAVGHHRLLQVGSFRVR